MTDDLNLPARLRTLAAFVDPDLTPGVLSAAAAISTGQALGEQDRATLIVAAAFVEERGDHDLAASLRDAAAT